VDAVQRLKRQFATAFPYSIESPAVTSRRLLKAAEAIREVVSSAIVTELRDPRVQNVTVVGVEVTPDMREAKVRVSIMGPPNKQDLCLRGLENAAGFLQSRIADRIDTRYTPKLRFVIDKGLQNAMAVGELLEQLRREREDQAAQKAGEADQESHEPRVDDVSHASPAPLNPNLDSSG
jgi:ribosome-binding factor A